ncbi:MAG: hypothetical protein IPK17_03500 [Chloroflexi bacterium]|uniref:penicillin-binding transpeptidase domain-containing protein n=1 Tax=Candidatus Flexifilum breve TaxID=3140694 RepID=UPI003136E654|nr:hypothetical protein [Chloroflexota bacterium]
MGFSREINRLLVGLLFMFGIVALSAAYWSITGPDTILRRADNPRRVEAERAIERGALVDRNDHVLAYTESADGIVTRRYRYPAMYSALGYYSYRYGSSGIEGAYDALLSGTDQVTSTGDALLNGLMHRPQVGSDARLTLDLEVQEAVAAALAGQTGAVIVIGVPNGEVLALASLPTYDPNTLDENWDALIGAPGNPFFNRALQGQYQPGAALQTPLLAAAMLVNIPLETVDASATQPVPLGDLNLACAVRLPEIELTLSEAYAFACPRAFADILDPIGVDTLNTVLMTFRLNESPLLAGFEPPPTSTPSTLRLTPDNLLETALGQGQFTVTPLSMALMAAGIVNDGNAPQPYLLQQSRQPDGAWIDVRTARASLPITTTNSARRLQDLMRGAVAFGAAQNAGRPGIDIGGHASIAYSGEGSQAWFVGFATFGGANGAAVAVILENSDDPGRAADIGGTALAAAQAALLGQPSS